MNTLLEFILENKTLFNIKDSDKLVANMVLKCNSSEKKKDI